jgi:hypothetical protein
MTGSFELTVMESRVYVSLFRRNEQTDRLTLEAFGLISLRNFIHEVLSLQRRVCWLCGYFRSVAGLHSRTQIALLCTPVLGMPWIRNDVRQYTTSRVSDSRKNVWVGKSLWQGENISGCLHVLMCRYNLYPAVVGASERERLSFRFIHVYRP